MKDHIYSAESKVEDHRRLDDWITPTTSDINPPQNASSNGSAALPLYMVFNDGHRLSIAVYSVLMVFSTIANITILVLLVKRKRQQPSRINTMLMHLAIADLLVSSTYSDSQIKLGRRHKNLHCCQKYCRYFGVDCFPTQRQ